MQLDDVHVDLVVRTPEEGGLPERSTRPDTLAERTQRTLDFKEALHEACERRLGMLVLGNPGSGKTTLLRRLAQIAFEDPDALGLAPEVVPIPYRLADVAKQPDGTAHALRDLETLTTWAVHARLQKTKKTAQAVTEALLDQDDRPLLYLLDGLDEIADLGLRQALAEALQDWQPQRPDRVFVISARFAGYDACRFQPSAPFLEAQVQPLGEKQQKALARKWFKRACEVRDDRREALDARVAPFLQRLARSEPRQRLAQNPLMLQLLCQLDIGRAMAGNDAANAEPQTRAALYDACVREMLGRKRRIEGQRDDDETPRDTRPLAKPLARRFLAIAASGLHAEAERRDAPTAFFADQLRAWERSVRAMPEATRTQMRSFDRDASALLDALYDQTSLLTPLSRDRDGRAHEHGFLHHTFQEYFTARHLAEAVQHGRGDADALLDRVAGGFGEAWWQEVLLLAMEEDDVDLFTPLMTRIARGGQMEAHRMLTHACVRAAQQRTRQTMTAQVLLDALADGIALDHDRYFALHLLRRLPGWDALRVGDERSGRDVVAAHLDDAERVVAKMAEELIASLSPSDVPPVDPEPGQIWVRARDGSAMVFVPGGTYVMGSENGDDDEKPVHSVTLSPFWIGRYPVTNAQYRLFVEAIDHRAPEIDEPWFDPGPVWTQPRYSDPEQPVVGVDWNDARAYARWVGLDLPSEAQWEAATRGATGRIYPWGDDEPTSTRANYRDVPQPSPVGAYPAGAGPFDALDQAGNVWEWCVDVWSDDAYARRDETPDPANTVGDTAFRACRGGSWFDGPWWLRGAYRIWGRVSSRDGNQGFRVAFRPCEHFEI
ncbi:MAG: SUMF1/EgtB/PvdO family nonheme iron enzyme [Acidobacteriota bacterium]